MKAFVRYIGIIDHNDKAHVVAFEPGVNLVTGKSSTGKSALVEIFDFCFGSSEFTIPEGIITKKASIYYVVINIQGVDLVLAREPNSTKAFIKQEREQEKLKNPNLKKSYFENDYILPLSDFKKEIGRWLGLRITDSEVNLTDRTYRGSKDPSPSIRSLSSFILQHQNLLANKHAIFYRFDEKEKRDQVIEHFKIFAGFVDQTYFIKMQELNELKANQRSLRNQIPKAEDRKKKAEVKLQNAIMNFSAISGMSLNLGSLSEIVRNPKRALESLQSLAVPFSTDSEENTNLRQQLENERSKHIADLRRSQQKLSSISASIKYAEGYLHKTDTISTPDEAELYASECPFCHSHSLAVEREANNLTEAIKWLNQELDKSKYLLESFEEQELKAKRDVIERKLALKTTDYRIALLDKQIVELEKYKTQYELALKAKLGIEIILEQLLERTDEGIEEQLKKIEMKIREINSHLKKEYNLEKNMKDAETEINANMKEIGNDFDFEESYKPINLHFSLDTFDLWNESDGKNTFLRSMGSGANWLYCHLTLFLALHRYFCKLGNRCLIPSIMFYDQPSQVYFPSAIDTANVFSPEDLAEKEGEARKRPVDDDIKAVSNLYSQLVKFCEMTLKETGIKPQIIVTDHADNLTLDGDIPFESLVRERWRNRGFIEDPN